MSTATKPVAGVDTPRADDIIVPCACGCGRYVVKPHPRHVLPGGRSCDLKTGRKYEWNPTPEWVEAEAAYMAKAGSRLVGCDIAPSKSAKERAQVRAEADKRDALREIVREIPTTPQERARITGVLADLEALR